MVNHGPWEYSKINIDYYDRDSDNWNEEFDCTLVNTNHDILWKQHDKINRETPLKKAKTTMRTKSEKWDSDEIVHGPTIGFSDPEYDEIFENDTFSKVIQNIVPGSNISLDKLLKNSIHASFIIHRYLQTGQICDLYKHQNMHKHGKTEKETHSHNHQITWSEYNFGKYSWMISWNNPGNFRRLDCTVSFTVFEKELKMRLIDGALTHPRNFKNNTIDSKTFTIDSENKDFEKMAVMHNHKNPF